MIIACAPDRRFSELAGVMLYSLFKNGEIGHARVIVFGWELRNSDKRKLRESCGGAGDRLEFIDIDASDKTLRWLSSFKPKLAPSIFARLLMPAILAEENDRLLYIDCDMIVVKSLRPLIEVDLEGCPVGATVDVAETHPANDPRGPRLPFAAELPYFNSGLMLFDLAKWREMNVSQAVYDVFEREGKRLSWIDQDALNMALIGRWKALDPTWNVHPRIAGQLGGYETACILHYTSRDKPWAEACDHPLQALYLEYREHTPWAGRRLETEFDQRLRKKIDKRKRWIKLFWKRLTVGAEPTPQRPRTT